MGWAVTDTEEGSGTILYAGVIAVLAALGILLAAVAGFLVAKQQAQGAADMAALAGADLSSVAVFGGQASEACSAVGEVAEQNGLDLVSCAVRGADIYVVVGRPHKIGPLKFTVEARARAGPAADPLEQ